MKRVGAEVVEVGCSIPAKKEEAGGDKTKDGSRENSLLAAALVFL